MYVTGLHTTVAIDAATCRTLWRYEWDPQALWIPINNRGVALHENQQSDEGRAALERAVAMKPDFGTAPMVVWSVASPMMWISGCSVEA